MKVPRSKLKTIVISAVILFAACDEVIDRTYPSMKTPGAEKSVPSDMSVQLSSATNIRYHFDIDADRPHTWVTLGKNDFTEFESFLKKSTAPLTSENFKTHYGCRGNAPYPMKADGSDFDSKRTPAYVLKTDWNTTWIFFDPDQSQVFLCAPSRLSTQH